MVDLQQRGRAGAVDAGDDGLDLLAVDEGEDDDGPGLHGIHTTKTAKAKTTANCTKLA